MQGSEPEIIRPATVADIPALSALFLEVFHTERPDSLWRWKLFENPRGTASWVCEVNGRIVAHCAGLPVRFRDYEREYTAMQSVDFMSSPSYPGGIGRGGVFVRTAERFFDACCGSSTVPLVYGFPGERHRLLGERLLGYRAIEPVGELRLESAGSGSEPEPLSVAHLPVFQKLPIDMGAVRDEIYLRWRYLSHPTFRYEVVRVRRALRLHSQIAALVRRTDDTVFVMEIGGGFSRRSLNSLAEALRYLGKPVVFWCSPHHPISRLLADSGFEVTARDHSIECRFFIQRDIPRAGEMYYTIGDYDVY